MRNTFFLLLILTFLHFSHVQAQSVLIDSSAFKTIRVDPQNCRGATVSEIFDQVDFIPLETNKESILGTISELKLINGNFLIYDSDTKCIFIFDKNGKFIAKIKPHSGDKEMGNLSNFNVVEQNGIKTISVNDNNKCFLFDQKGKFVKRVALNNEDQSFLNVNRDYSLKDYYRENDSTLYQYTLHKEKKLYARYFPAFSTKDNPDIFYSPVGANQQDLSSNFFLTKWYSYEIYKLSPPTLNFFCKIIFPKEISLPTDFLTNPIYIGRANRKKFFDANKKVIYGLSNIFLFGNNLFFKIGTRNSDESTNSSIVYNFKSKEAITLNHIEPDAKSFYLPINDSGIGLDFRNYGFQLYENDFLYLSYSSRAIFQYKGDYEKKNLSLDPVLTQFFKTQNNRSNPIIVRLKPKFN